MYRKLFTMLFLVSFAALLSAQTVDKFQTLKKDIYKDVTTHSALTLSKPNAVFPVKNNPLGDTVATTIFGVVANSIIRDQIKYADGKVYMVPMIEPNSKGNRSVTLIMADGANYAGYEVNGAAGTNRTGWGALDIQRTGSAIGTIGVVAHTPNTLNIWDPGTKSLIQSKFDPNTDPSIAFSGDNIFLAESGNRVDDNGYRFWKTTDYGLSFTMYDSLKKYSPKPIFYFGEGGTEVDIAKSPDEKYLAYVGTATAGSTGQHVYNGVNPDSADCAWIIYSSDAGSTWTGKTIGCDGWPGKVKDYPMVGYSPLFENFGQVKGAISNDGNIHVVANGYGLDTTEGNVVCPVLYWNSKKNYWVSVSSFAIDTIQNLTTWRQGNGIGQAWPAVSVSPDGKVVLVTWSGPQITGGKIDTTMTVVTSSSDTSKIDLLTDTYYAYSVDGGNKFTYGGAMPGNDTKKFSEQFCSLDQHLVATAGGYNAYMFFYQALPPFSQSSGARAANPLVWRKFFISSATAVNDAVQPEKFELSQNYPNPFNPSTVIKYSVPASGKVTLKVYDVLGKEVASLVNDVKNAGSYEVNFDASKLSSGMYIYSINAGNYSASKKMMLIK